MRKAHILTLTGQLVIRMENLQTEMMKKSRLNKTDSKQVKKKKTQLIYTIVEIKLTTNKMLT